MLLSVNKKSLFAIYFAVNRPCITLAHSNMNMTTVKEESGTITGRYSVAYVTAPSTDVGKALAHQLVAKKLAACVNIIPNVISVYKWKEQINEDDEALLMVKTRSSLVPKLIDFVRENHPYEICEVITLPIQNGNPPYLKWIEDSLPET